MKPSITLLKDSEWSAIDGQPCRVSEFQPLPGNEVKDSHVVSADSSKLRASIILECKSLSDKAMGFITHKEDFLHLWSAFEVRCIASEEEVIIFRTRNQYNYTLYRLFAPFMPKLWVMICPKGAYELFDKDYKPDLQGEARWNALAPIVDWKPNVMK